MDTNRREYSFKKCSWEYPNSNVNLSSSFFLSLILSICMSLISCTKTTKLSVPSSTSDSKSSQSTEDTSQLNLQINTNKPMSVFANSQRIISLQFLLSSDNGSTTDKIVYTITSVPRYGIILKNNSNITISSKGTFTQEDINQGRITYQHLGGPSTFDSFGFSVSNGELIINQQVFNLLIDQSTGPLNVQLSSPESEPVLTTPSIQVIIEFTNLVAGFEQSDLIVTNATVSNFRGNGKNYDLLLTAQSQGNFTLQIPANVAINAAQVGNNPSNLFIRTYDSLAPIAPSNVTIINASRFLSQPMKVTWTSAVDPQLATHRIKACIDKNCSTNCTSIQEALSPVPPVEIPTPASGLPSNITPMSPGYPYYGCVQGVDQAGNTTAYVASPYPVAYLGPNYTGPEPNLWVMGDGPSILDSNNMVTSWVDQSIMGTQFDLGQPITGQQPQLIDGLISNRPGLRFDGIDDFLESSLTISDIMSSNSFTAFSAFQINSNQQVGPSTWENQAIFSDSLGYVGLYLENATLYGLNQDTDIDLISHPVNIGRPAMATLTHDPGNNLSLSVNSNPSIPPIMSTNTADMTGTFRVGRNQGVFNRYLESDIGEIIIFNIPLSPLNTQLIRSYLSNKYSINRQNSPPYITIMGPNNRLFPIDGTATDSLTQGENFLVNLMPQDPDMDSLLFIDCTIESLGLDISDPNYTETGTPCTQMPSLSQVGSITYPSTISFNYVLAPLPSATFSWTPKYDQRGTFKITFITSDGQSIGQNQMVISVREDFPWSDEIDFYFDSQFSQTSTVPGALTYYGSIPRIDGSGLDDTSDVSNLAAANNYLGTLTNFTSAPWMGNGLYYSPYSLEFISTGPSFLKFPLTSVLGANNDVSLVAWIKAPNLDSTAVSTQIIAGKENSGGPTLNYQFGVTTGPGPAPQIEVCDSTPACERSDNVLISDRWQMISATLSETTNEVKTFHNGRESDTDPLVITLTDSPSQNLRLGIDGDEATNPYLGEISQAIFYFDKSTDILGSTDILEMFEATANRYRKVPIENVFYDGIILHLDAANSLDGILPVADNCSLSSTNWQDLGPGDSSGTGPANSKFELTLSNFNPTPCETSSGWAGGGLPGDPYYLRFDGVDDFIDFPLTNPIATTQGTIDLWVRSQDSNQPAGSAVISTHNAVSGDSIQIELDGGTPNLFQVGIMGTDSVVIGEASNTWQHLAVTYNGPNVTTYLNGTMANQFNYPGFNNLIRRFTLGRDRIDTEYFNGDVALLRFYNRSLSLEEVQQNCLAQESRFTTGPLTTICTSPLVGTISTFETNPTSSNPIEYSVSFNAQVNDFTENDIVVTGGTIEPGSFSGNGTNFTFNIIPDGPGQTITVDIPAYTASSGSLYNAASPQSTITYNSAPVITHDQTANLLLPLESLYPAHPATTPLTVNLTITDGEDDWVLPNCTYETIGLDPTDTRYATTYTPCSKLTYQYEEQGELKSSPDYIFDHDTNTGTWVWVPSATQVGTYKFIFTADDQTTVSKSAPLYVTVRPNYIENDSHWSILDGQFSNTADSSVYPVLAGLPATPRLDGSAADDQSFWTSLFTSGDKAQLNFTDPQPWGSNSPSGFYGHKNYILHLDGNGDYLNLGDPLVGQDQGMIAAWVKFDALNNGERIWGNGGGYGNGVSLDIASSNRLEYSMNDKDYQSEIIFNGPVSYWRLNDPTPGVSVNTINSSLPLVIGADTTIDNSTPIGADPNGTSVLFNARDATGNVLADSQMSIQNSLITNDTSGGGAYGLSIEIWVYLKEDLVSWTTNPPNVNTIYTTYNSTTNTGLFLRQKDDQWEFGFYNGTDLNIVVSTVPVVRNKWTQLTATIERTLAATEIIKLYVNGRNTEDDTRIGSNLYQNNTSSTDDFLIGTGPTDTVGTNNQPFFGLMDELSIYHYTLSDTQVFNNYTAAINCRSLNTIDTNSWYLLSVHYEEDNFSRMYINGKKQCEVANEGNLDLGADTNFIFGAASTGPGPNNAIEADLSQLRIYQSQLPLTIATEEDIFNDFAKTANQFRINPLESLASEDNLLVHLDAQNAKLNMNSYPAATCPSSGTNTDQWSNLSSVVPDLTLTNFSGCAFGNTWEANPSRLIFDPNLSNDQGEIAADPLTDLSETFTIEAWIKPPTILTTNQAILSKGDANINDFSFYIKQNGSGQNVANFKHYQSGQDQWHPNELSTEINIDLNEWQHIAFSKMAGTSNNWLGVKNGKRIFQFSVDFNLDSTLSNKILIGSNRRLEEYGGELAIIRLYDQGLSTKQLFHNFTSQADRFRSSPIEEILQDSLMMHLNASNAKNGLTTYTPTDPCPPTPFEWFNLGQTKYNATMSSCTLPTEGFQAAVGSDPDHYLMDGSGSSFKVISPVELNRPPAGITLEMWVRNDSPGGQWSKSDEIFVSKKEQFAFGTMTNSNEHKFEIKVDGPETVGVSYPYFNMNRWHHLAATYDGNLVKIFEDGLLKAQNQVTTPNSLLLNDGGLISIGGPDVQSSTTTMEGRLYNSRIYSRALSGSEIRYNFDIESKRFRSTIPNFVLTGNVLHYDAEYAEGKLYFPGSYCPAQNYVEFHDLGPFDFTGQLINFTTCGVSGWGGSTPDVDPYYLLFDGMNDHIKVSPEEQLNLIGDLSFESWVCVPSSSKNSGTIYGHYTLGPDDKGLGFQLYNPPSDGNDNLYVGFMRNETGASTWLYDSSLTPINDGNWHHVAFTNKNNTGQFYVDGTAVGATVTVPAVSSIDTKYPVTIGAGQNGLLDYFKGRFSSLRVFNRALNANEIQYNYSLETTRFPAGLACP